MKKLAGVCLAVILLLGVLCGCGETKDENLAAKIEAEIESEYLADALLPSYGTTIGMVELAEKYEERWSEVADEYYKKIMNEGDKALRSKVETKKTDWEAQSQKQLSDYIDSLKEQYGSGSIIGPLVADYKMKQQKQFALELVSIYQG